MRASLNDESIDLEKLGKTKGVLSNIDIESRPIPTALFMGGREIEILNKDNGFRIDLQENQDSLIEVLPQIIENQSLILPCPIAVSYTHLDVYKRQPSNYCPSRQ